GPLVFPERSAARVREARVHAARRAPGRRGAVRSLRARVRRAAPGAGGRGRLDPARRGGRAGSSGRPRPRPARGGRAGTDGASRAGPAGGGAEAVRLPAKPRLETLRGAKKLFTIRPLLQTRGGYACSRRGRPVRFWKRENTEKDAYHQSVNAPWARTEAGEIE